MIAKTKNVLWLIISASIFGACVVIFLQGFSEGTRRTELIKTTQPIQDYQIVSGWRSSGRNCSTYYVEIKWQGRNFSSILLPDSISYAYSRDSIFWAPLYRLHYYYDKHDDEIFCKEEIDVMKDLFFGVFFLLVFLVNLFFQIIEYRDLHKK